MTKHPLLPDHYVDASMHTKIIASLKPYEINLTANPNTRWNLPRAWQDAQPLLAGAHWRYNGNDGEDTVDSGWELTADTKKETDDLHTIVAGIVARQIQAPESGLAIRRIEQRQEETGLIISNQVQGKLREMFPDAHYEGFNV